MPDPHPLLELQRIDLIADALRERRAGLPQRALLSDCERASAELTQQRAEAGERLVALGREERRAEAEVADARAKAREAEATLYSGRIKVTKELEALQASLRELQRGQGAHEEVELALMAQEEQLGDEISAMSARLDALETEAASIRRALGASEAEIDETLAELAVERRALVERVSAALLAKYETLRAAPPLKGRAAVRIDGGSCSGCRSTIPIALASRFESQPADATAECPRCGRMLLR